jgi:hypothetical protein
MKPESSSAQNLLQDLNAAVIGNDEAKKKILRLHLKLESSQTPTLICLVGSPKSGKLKLIQSMSSAEDISIIHLSYEDPPQNLHQFITQENGLGEHFAQNSIDQLKFCYNPGERVGTLHFLIFNPNPFPFIKKMLSA